MACSSKQESGRKEKSKKKKDRKNRMHAGDTLELLL
jgi:hypothetical protein